MDRKDFEKAGFKYIGNIHDMNAHEKISKELQEKKGIGKEEADKQAGKILSAAKAKGKGKGTKEQMKKEQMKEFGNINELSKSEQEKAYQLLNWLHHARQMAENFVIKAEKEPKIIERARLMSLAESKEDEAQRLRERLVNLFSEKNLDEMLL